MPGSREVTHPKVSQDSAKWQPTVPESRQLRAALCKAAITSTSEHPSTRGLAVSRIFHRATYIDGWMDFLFFWTQTRSVACAVAMETQFPNGTKWRKAAKAKSGPIHLARLLAPSSGRFPIDCDCLFWRSLACQAEWRNRSYLKLCFASSSVACNIYTSAIYTFLSPYFLSFLSSC
jgi:hypothetical protein